MSSTRSRPALLFDLDGTLTDPFVGITRSLSYALEKLGRIAPAADDLRWCIGPPIQANFRKLLDTEDEALIWEGVLLYRERYSDVGKFENTLIPGIPETLAEFSSGGFFLSVATSKLKSYAREIIEHFALAPYFQAVHGSEPDGGNAVKADLIRHILASERLEAETSVMIGDRLHDVVGAKANAVPAIGVLWGYGSREELEESGAAALAAVPAELARLVRSLLPAARGL